MTTPILTTARLTLRPITLFDAGDITKSLSNAAVAGWLTAVPYPYTLQDAEDFIRDVAQDPDDPHWAIDAGLGLIGVISCRAELGYWLDAAHHGKGYMTEAATAAINHHFGQTDDDLISGYHLGNTVSANVLRKLGFTDTRVEDEIRVATGKPVRTQKMHLTRAQWENRHA